jgi:SAM-dependent methyltransferase
MNDGVRVAREVSLRPYLRWRDYAPFLRRYNEFDRASVLLARYRDLLEGRVLDVGCGDAYGVLRAALGSTYEGLDIGDSYKYENAGTREGQPEHLWNVEREALPFPEASYDTVLCIGALEHLDNIHQVYDELFRVARRRVIVMLPNNWVGLVGSLVVGHNYTHRAGYGLGPREKSPGQRHKYFFNLEEAGSFLLGRVPRGWSVRLVECSFERGADTWLAWRPYAVASSLTWPRLVRRFGRGRAIAFSLLRAPLYYPLRVVEWTIGMAIWGIRGPSVYHNLMCREIWVVFDRR